MSWKVLATRVLVDRPWLRVHEERLRLPHGAIIEDYHVIEHVPWSTVVCLAENGQLILVRQFRRGIEGTSLELPAGMLEAGESALDAAKRELREETGYESDDWTSLGAVSPDPPRTKPNAHLFFARGAQRTAATKLDRTEAQIEVQLCDVKEALAKAASGAMVHGVQLGALFIARERGLL